MQKQREVAKFPVLMSVYIDEGLRKSNIFDITNWELHQYKKLRRFIKNECQIANNRIKS